MKTKYFVSNDLESRKSFIKGNSKRGKKVAIYNQLPLRGLENSFTEIYKLSDLYNDETFLRLLAKIDKHTTVYLIDLGLDYCSFKADYIKPYMKLHPISTQAKETFIIDGFAFYNTEKAIYRPFLYIDPLIIGSSVQEFYNSKGFESFDGNKIENYYQIIKPYIKISNKPLEVEVVKYELTDEEKNAYNELKNDVIMVQKLSKQRIISLLEKFIFNCESRKKAIREIYDPAILNVTSNSKNSRVKMYKDILLENPKKVVFYSSGFFGVDEMELSRTKDAILRHNELIKLLNG